jgi:hypothetical protein
MTAPDHSGRHPCLGRSPSRRVCRSALSVTLLGALVACRAPSPRTAAPDRVPPPAAAHELGDASYDWHGLLIAPFGSVLKDIPVALHEVLLFRDDAHGNASPGNAATGGAGADAAVVDAECYAADAPAPRFVGRIPEEYLLCFNQGRLSRIQASVRVPAAQAPEAFAAACTGWLKSAASTTGAEAPRVGTPGESPSADACQGRDGAIHFRGRLAEEPNRGAETPQPESVLSITLDSAPYP